MKILYSATSPYSAKVRMAADYLALGIESEAVVTNDGPGVLLDNNPLGKIPVLVRDGLPPVFDSVAIMQFMNRLANGRLYPHDPEQRTEAEVLEALCDGITDCLIGIIYEKRFRPEEIVHQPWIDKQWGKAARGLDFLEAKLPQVTETLHGGHFALAALRGYLDLRYSGQWEQGRPTLAAWPLTFERHFANYAALKPQV